jgi:CDP-glucose 4,6-dehydratase
VAGVAVTAGAEVDPEFWRGRRVLLTGHTGFKGSWLSLWLQRLGADVTGLALAPATQPSLYELADVGQGMTSMIGDILDPECVMAAFTAARPEVVIHMAAQSLVRVSYAEPVATYAVNVMGTAHVLDAIRRTPGVRSVVVVTTDKCYENREWLWSYRENEPLGGYDPYSSSKACAELVTAAFRSSYFGDPSGPRIATARAGNVIGGGDWAPDRLVPDAIRAFAAGEVLRIRNPAAVRPWQHVLEPLAGYLLLAERLWEDPAAAEAWNFGPGEDGVQTVSWVLEHLAAQWGGLVQWEAAVDQSPHEAQMLRLDSARARARLGWRPRLPLARALDAVVGWHRGLEAGTAAADLVGQDINAYCGAAPWIEA